MGFPTIIGLAVCGGTVILNIISLATPNWLDDLDSHTGLWVDCDYAAGSKLCQRIGSDAPAFLRATQAMELLGLFILIGSFSCVLIRIVFMKEKERLSIIGGAASIIAGCFLILGGIIFGGTFKSYGGNADDLSAGFALTFVAGGFSIVTGIIFILGRHH